MIEVTGEQVIYENPVPYLRSRHGYFPGVVEVPSGDLLAMFQIGEAFEAVNCRANVSRSKDKGRTWELEGPFYDMSKLAHPMSDTVKATVLSDGTLIAMGYWYDRSDPEKQLGNPETGGSLPSENIVTFSSDEGRTWTTPEEIANGYPEPLEVSGPCVELPSGDLLAIGATMVMWDGSCPSGKVGVAFRSSDKGRTWDTSKLYFTTPGNEISPYEARLCVMGDGRIVALVWAYDHRQGKNLNNHVVVSHDDGRTWSAPMDTGVAGQASGIMPLHDEVVLTIHAHREGDLGLYVRVVDFVGDRWRVVEEKNILSMAGSTEAKGSLADVWGGLRFGQPSCVRLSTGEILAVCWAVEGGQGRIRSWRLEVEG